MNIPMLLPFLKSLASGKPESGSVTSGVNVVSTQLADLNDSLATIIEQNEKIIFQLSLITGFNGNE